MQQFTPLELCSYFLVFQCHFSKPNFVDFQGYLWGLLLARGRKTMNNIAHCGFWVERSLSSWERFLSENLWDVNAVGKTLVTLLLQKLESQLQVHGGYLAALDTLLVPKNGKKMSGVQLWKDHSGNADRGERLLRSSLGHPRINQLGEKQRTFLVLAAKNEANFWEIKSLSIHR